MSGFSAAAALRPTGNAAAIAFDLACVIGGSLLIAVFAQVVIPLPFTPVPISGATFAVMLVPALLGGGRGAASSALYLGQGALGLPFFASGNAGVAYMTGPTGGYLAGYLAAAIVVGWLADRGWTRSYGKLVVALGIGTAVIYLLGVSRLALFVPGSADSPLGLGVALSQGLWPFLPGDLIKIAAIVSLLPTGWRLLGDPEQSRPADTR